LFIIKSMEDEYFYRQLRIKKSYWQWLQEQKRFGKFPFQIIDELLEKFIKKANKVKDG